MIDVDVKLKVGDFSLDVAFKNENGVTALFGQSGSGKSVTLGVIAGLMRPDSGHVRLDGEPLVDVEAGIFIPVSRRRIGLVFQDANLFPHLSVKQNLLYGRWFAPRDARRIDFDAVVDTLGVGALLSRPPTRLSGGERQRVAIGRALLSCPKLLLFDEPLAALDMRRKLEILPLIERVRDDFKIPIVYVSHAVEEVARLAPCVVMIEAGRVKFVGDPATAFSRLGIMPTQDRFDVSSVLEAQIEDRPSFHGLVALRHPAGTIWAPGPVGPPGGVARVIVRATDVVLSLVEPKDISTRSILSGKVASIDFDGRLAIVEIALAEKSYLLATITRGAMEDLSLKPGSTVYALFKSAALDERSIA
ncbi:molybdenum ABC transporter ATP-binding protein [Methylocystis parvus]|uniref:Molybdenum ABC transporter ATP-binding protein n=1 Tax=Methylocystis parvus TaxID=134 RepID=A0A6B8M379_9HYPH|nr:molybdenum ABC transporter ATP-binding protein [Methylocystis parvus]QGM96795.1 molybdenum ABC transporter ATP-binding protein [Methylocystis parvus]WBJ99328.1 molybdenum ABC transporter ATP-binding protein [Methylocystis parvus OBBP]